MSTLAYQEALARIVTNPKLREAVMQGAPAAGADHQLSAAQREWLRQLDSPRVEAFARLAMLNRLGKVTHGLPLTTKLLDTDLWPMMSEYCQQVPPSGAKKYEEALAFASFLQQRLEAEGVGGLLRDVLGYERAAIEVRFGRAPTTSELSSLPGRPLRAMSARKLVPRCIVNCEVVSVSFDFDVLAERAMQEGPLTDTPRRDMIVLLYRLESGYLGQAEISLPTAAFLLACDGESTIDQISRRLARDFEQPEHSMEFQAACWDICDEFVERGILTVAVR